MINKNWARWIQASLTTYFKQVLETDNSLVFYVEALSREKSNAKNVTDWVEQRWNGPFIKEHSRNLFCLDIEINFVVNSVVNRQDTYTHKQIVGIVMSSLVNNISVFKFGDGVDDDEDVLLGCLQLRVDNKSGIFTNYFGRTQDAVEIEQSTVEASYYMYLKT